MEVSNSPIFRTRKR